MAIFLIISSALLWIASGWTLRRRPLLSPALSFVALYLLSLAKNGDHIPLLPINTTILIGWMCMTVVVMLATMLQPYEITSQSRGFGYILGGALTGMAIGLMGTSLQMPVSMAYGIMIVATVAGTFFGYLLFTNTPAGAAVGLRSGRFFTYLLAKGFPTAITVMQLGVALVILIALYQTQQP